MTPVATSTTVCERRAAASPACSWRWWPALAVLTVRSMLARRGRTRDWSIFCTRTASPCSTADTIAARAGSSARTWACRWWAMAWSELSPSRATSASERASWIRPAVGWVASAAAAGFSR